MVFLSTWSFFKAVGGIPVDRSRKTSLVDQMVHNFAKYKKFNLAITPEGTRKANPNWKKVLFYSFESTGSYRPDWY